MCLTGFVLDAEYSKITFPIMENHAYNNASNLSQK